MKGGEMQGSVLSQFGGDDPLDIVIEELGFSVKTHYKLKDADIHIIRSLVQLEEPQLRLAGLTTEMIYEVKAVLDKLGLRLGM
jgi:DNA-directed RNA polymerase alpha subunit